MNVDIILEEIEEDVSYRHKDTCLENTKKNVGSDVKDTQKGDTVPDGCVLSLRFHQVGTVGGFLIIHD